MGPGVPMAWTTLKLGGTCKNILDTKDTKSTDIVVL